MSGSRRDGQWSAQFFEGHALMPKLDEGHPRKVYLLSSSRATLARGLLAKAEAKLHSGSGVLPQRRGHSCRFGLRLAGHNESNLGFHAWHSLS
jgi:hypothetical protein